MRPVEFPVGLYSGRFEGVDGRRTSISVSRKPTLQDHASSAPGGGPVDCALAFDCSVRARMPALLVAGREAGLYERPCAV